MKIDYSKEKIIIPKYPTCFVCGPENKRGLGLTFIAYGDMVEAEFIPEKNLCGYTGIVHGGITASIIDEGMGWTAYAQTRKFYLTAELQLRYKKPVKYGRKYIFRAKLIDIKKKLFKAEGELVDSEDGTICVTGFAKYFLVDGNPEDEV
ncbi:MAG: PaaI family thioesterase [Candidatus Zixiibacteriota bacterium]